MVEINAYSKAKDGGKKLSANFTVKEFACKDGSERRSDRPPAGEGLAEHPQSL